MRRIVFALLVILVISPSAWAQEYKSGGFVRSLTLEGGPIASHHFQASENNFHQRHTLGIVKLGTRDYGTWGVYVLSPNSVEDTSIGVGYVFSPYVVPLGPTELELTGALGAVTGYQNYPVPLLAGEARLRLFESGPWNAGVAMAALPYITDDDVTGDTVFGIVATTPFLSIRYRFE